MRLLRPASARQLIVLLLVTLSLPSAMLAPDPAVVAAAQLRPSAQDQVPPATPGTYRSASSAANTPITGVTITKPSGTTTNDVLLAAITIRGDVVTITPPSGWTQVRTDANGTVLNQTIYRKVAGGSEPASYTWTFGDAVPAAVGGIVAYSGVSTTTPVDVSGGQANAASTTVTAPSVTTTVANTRVVGFFGTTNDTTFTPPSGMTERYDTDANGSTQVAAEAADVAQAAAGATGTKAATAGTSNANIGQLVALRPSGTIALRAASSAETVPTTSLAIPTPAGVVADDVLVASIATRADDAATPPAGWTLVRSDASATVLRQSVYVRTAVSGEPASHTWTFAGPVATAVGGILAFSGIDPVDPVDLAGGQVNASATSATAPSITTTVSDSTLVALYSIANDATFTPPSGMTERFDLLANTFSDGAATAADVSVAAAGATGTKVATASKAGVNIGILVALRPATATANLGMEPQHTFETWDLGAGDGLAVNVATRNTLITHPLVSLPIRGSAVRFGLTWNAKDRTDLGMGPGWRLDVFRRLRINGNGSVTFSDGTGARHAFTNPVTVGAITTYTRPASLYATLTKDTTPNPDRFTLVYRDLSTDTFEVNGTDGLLVREADRFGNGVDLAYNAGTTNLATITDTVPNPDRVIDVTWDTAPTPDRLTKITDWAYISGGVVQTGATGSRREHRFSYTGQGTSSAGPILPRRPIAARPRPVIGPA